MYTFTIDEPVLNGECVWVIFQRDVGSYFVVS